MKKFKSVTKTLLSNYLNNKKRIHADQIIIKIFWVVS